MTEAQPAGHAGGIAFRGGIVAKKAPKAEYNFYQELFSPELPDPVFARMRNYVPNFSGVEGELILIENLKHGMAAPSIVDLKLGAVTYNVNHDADSVAWYKAKSALTSSVRNGFRIAGYSLVDENGTAVDVWPRNYCYLIIDDEELKDPIRAMFTIGGRVDANLVRQCQAASQEILEFFREQRYKTFIAMSLLLVVDKKTRTFKAKLIDFAHPFDAQGQADTNVIHGLENVVRLLNAIAAEAS
mmetsp:Transcript_31116/g.54076  ORF Transcript_31116/g.54076 Transcript_31116/m.54076 type:complete len:243 (-) Transcript_31116:45-773(-)|eukprot:CAMPEP_0204905790 /NCGR_PEP_ID=MMETSP1397-20131031/5623_1 /ASSEMBLY_ACC=CAM_ASM_000891 /TAXON_ID=49980 /ORGANISM="Climacostomum Climacostomum virens, Strain Stock W-24" /LENGTH=242 /DNA_ID=CAMNT_0052074723 /DNA_START=495 /DNA_END=1223 /DNA_ORIENTATION=-